MLWRPATARIPTALVCFDTQRIGRTIPAYIASLVTMRPSDVRPPRGKTDVLLSARRDREAVALRKAVVRSEFRLGLPGDWTFVKLRQHAHGDATTAVDGHVEHADMLALQGDPQFGLFLEHAMDGMTLSEFRSLGRISQVGIVQMYAYWKNPRRTGSAEPWNPTAIVRHANRFDPLREATREEEELHHSEAGTSSGESRTPMGCFST